MVSILPIRRALVPADSTAAGLITAPNYDEFLKSSEIWPYVVINRHNVLGITMAHEHPENPFQEGSPMALARAIVNMDELIESDLTVEQKDLLYIYEICGNTADSVRQIGLGGYAKTAEIRTKDTSQGVILRNEEVIESKVEGRKELIEATNATIGVVNCAVEDTKGDLLRALEKHADKWGCDYQVTDENNDTHKIWLLAQQDHKKFIDILAKEPRAYVNDGNHRSAAAAMVGNEEFLSVFFPAKRMRIGPYNRLVKANSYPGGMLELCKSLERSFTVIRPKSVPYQPNIEHNIGLYTENGWNRLVPHPNVYRGGNPVEQIDSDIIHQEFFKRMLGIENTKDPCFEFVGAKYDTEYLQKQVDSGEFRYAVTLPPVTMEQIIAVCKANLFMPPKSTWFLQKIRSGLVMALRG